MWIGEIIKKTHPGSRKKIKQNHRNYQAMLKLGSRSQLFLFIWEIKSLIYLHYCLSSTKIRRITYIKTLRYIKKNIDQEKVKCRVKTQQKRPLQVDLLFILSELEASAHFPN